MEEYEDQYYVGLDGQGEESEYSRPVPAPPPPRARNFGSPQEEAPSYGESDTQNYGQNNSSGPGVKSILKKTAPNPSMNPLGPKICKCKSCLQAVMFYPSLNPGPIKVRCHHCPTINEFTEEDWLEATAIINQKLNSGNPAMSTASKSASLGSTTTNAAKSLQGTLRVLKQKAAETQKKVAHSNFVAEAKKATEGAVQKTKTFVTSAKDSLATKPEKDTPPKQPQRDHTVPAAQQNYSNALRGDTMNATLTSPVSSPLSSSQKMSVYTDTAVFGIPLEIVTGRTANLVENVPDIVVKAVTYLCNRGIKEEGIFRLSGSASEINKLKENFDKGIDVDLTVVKDEHCISSILKSYFRELPEPIWTNKLAQAFRATEKLMHDQPAMVAELRSLVNQLPTINRAVLEYLMKFLFQVSSFSAQNKMSPQNIAIVFAPTLAAPIEVIGPLVSHCDEIFAENLIEF